MTSPPDRPTANVYDNDVMAVAGLSVAAETGLRVPEDGSLPAWDDSQLCRLTHPTLSAMSHEGARVRGGGGSDPVRGDHGGTGRGRIRCPRPC